MSIVLITNISKLPQNGNTRKYSCILKKCKDDNSERLTVDAIHTNVSVLKGLKLYLEKNEKPLIDKIITLVSNDSNNEQTVKLDNKPITNTAFNYYKTEVKTLFNNEPFVKEYKILPSDDKLYELIEPEEKVPEEKVPEEKVPEQIEIIKLLFEPTETNNTTDTEAGRKERILAFLCDNLKDGDTVYIDSASGARNISNIIQLLAQILKYRNIENPLNLYSDIQNNNGRIVDTREITKMTDLADAFNEFMKSGKSSQLLEIYSDAQNPIDNNGKDKEPNEDAAFVKLISSMNDFSDKIRLGLVDTLESTIEVLRGNVTKCKECKATRFNSIIIKQFLPLIENRLIGETNDNSVDYLRIIEWCVDNDLIQQALTLIVEKLPEIFVDNNLISYENRLEAEELFNSSIKSYLQKYHNYSSFNVYSFYNLILEKINKNGFNTNFKLKAAKQIENKNINLDELELKENKEADIAKLYYGYIFAKENRNRICHSSDDTDFLKNNGNFFVNNFIKPKDKKVSFNTTDQNKPMYFETTSGLKEILGSYINFINKILKEADKPFIIIKTELFNKQIEIEQKKDNKKKNNKYEYINESYTIGDSIQKDLNIEITTAQFSPKRN